ncbi:hypothetical protein F4809DRAFT_419946 [Biscogniauxia mediterranea]|nr:hypothetical protein F4809DRAFT_419946 [Biscogniauxia mediterranea]
MCLLSLIPLKTWFLGVFMNAHTHSLPSPSPELSWALSYYKFSATHARMVKQKTISRTPLVKGYQALHTRRAESRIFLFISPPCGKVQQRAAL